MMSKFLVLVCFVFCFGCSHQLLLSSSFSDSTKLVCPPHQAHALLHFKKSLSAMNESGSWVCNHYGGNTTSYPKTESWKEGSDCCSWDGVTCDFRTGHVIELDLTCSWLSGTIPSNSSLFLLPHLRSLNLAFNDFAGSSISAGFGRLSSLTRLNLSHSGFSGLIPPEISHLSNLVSLDLSSNWGAEFPPGGFSSLVRNLTKLQKLHLGGTSISSPLPFPNSLLNRSSLISLDLSWVGLRGRFPDHDIHLPKLQLLSLRGNADLTGNFPGFSENNSLTALDFSLTSFSGELPTSMGNLKYLQTLDLSNCDFSGSIPATLGNLTRITSFRLAGNHFGGQIPNVFHSLRNLISLRLSNNNFSGQLPPSIGNLTNLHQLDISENRLEGAIPSMVNGFQSLSSLDLGHNLLNGTIPPWLYTLPSLVELDLSHNEFTGPIGEFQFHSLEDVDLSMNELQGSIPSSIFEFVNLTSLHLYSNNLAGVLETSKFEKLRYLTVLDLANNMLSFTMSSSSNSMLPNIEDIDVSHNNISGTWAWNVGKETLYYLNLSYNSISGFETFPWKGMKILDLHSNSLHGPLPTPPTSTFFFSVSRNELVGKISPRICEASSTGVLDLSYNSLRGMLPPCLGNFSGRLSVLNLRGNRFHGVIPQTFSKGNAIRSLDFNDNQLEGVVPRSLIICRQLEVLNIGNNKINDTFPHFLSSLPELRVLILRSNRFHGEMGFSGIESPFMNLRIVDLAHNDFEGDLPELYLKSLSAAMDIDESNMTREYMGDGYYQDSVTVTTKGYEIELLKILNTFTTIDLSCNRFQGGIPECIGDLHSLRGLNLSHNKLTGHIPSSFGNLKLLESLDLSSNNLTGRIPRELMSMTFLEVLNLTQNQLTGVIPRGNQFETFGNDSYDKNPGLCGFPLSKKCTASEPELESSEEDDDAESENGFDWKLISLMGYGCGLVIGLSLGCLVLLSGKPAWLVGIIEENMPSRSRSCTRSACRRRARTN